MVDNYAAWYDRHFDPSWQDIILNPPDDRERRTPVAYTVPRSAEDLRRMGRCYSATLFLSAGNVTHTPAYGNLITLGILLTAQEFNRYPEHVDNAATYRQLIADTGRFLTFSFGAATFGYRFRENPEERAALRIVKETDAGVAAGQVVNTSWPCRGRHRRQLRRSKRALGEFRRAGRRSPGVLRNHQRYSTDPSIAAEQPLRRARRPMWLDDVFASSAFCALVASVNAATPDTIVLAVLASVGGWLAKAGDAGPGLACSG